MRNLPILIAYIPLAAAALYGCTFEGDDKCDGYTPLQVNYSVNATTACDIALENHVTAATTSMTNLEGIYCAETCGFAPVYCNLPDDYLKAFAAANPGTAEGGTAPGASGSYAFRPLGGVLDGALDDAPPADGADEATPGDGGGDDGPAADGEAGTPVLDASGATDAGAGASDAAPDADGSSPPPPGDAAIEAATDASSGGATSDAGDGGDAGPAQVCPTLADTAQFILICTSTCSQ
jgi:hypothetical protein